ncbi:MAG: IMPACT family protein [bacterium]
MLFSTHYQTVSKYSESIYKDKGSKFIACLQKVESIEEFKVFLNETKKKYPIAVHYCFAYRIGYDKSILRANDDGEPSGSAGKPIYNQLLAFDLTNVSIIVVRYFGGTLLGVPGLINAYKQSSIDAIKENEIVIKDILEIAKIEFSFEKMNEVMKVIKENKIKITEQGANEKYELNIEVPFSTLTKSKEAFNKIESLVYHYLQSK